MSTDKIVPGSEFPELNVFDSNDNLVDISKPSSAAKMQMIVTYRHRNCGKCTDHLNNLSKFRQRLLDINVDLAAVSCGSKGDLQDHLTRLEVNFPLYYGLKPEQARDLGLHISPPEPPKVEHEFSEPGLFVIYPNGQLGMVSISNNPILRPDLNMLVSTLEQFLGK